MMKTDHEDNVFNLLVSRFLPYWPLYVVLLLLCLVFAWLYIKSSTPIYEATATLIIKDENKGVDDAKMMESINPFESKKIVENEIEIIQSRSLMRRVVDSLHLYAPVFEDRTFGEKSAYTNSPIVIELKNPERILMSSENSDRHYFDYDKKKNTVNVDGKNYPLNEWIEVPTYGLMRYRPNPSQSDEIKKSFYYSFVHPKYLTNGLLNSLAVNTTNKLSTVVRLVYWDAIPKRAEDVLNYLIAAYNEKAVEDRNVLAVQTLDFIEERMNNVEQELETLEKEIQMFRSEKGVVDLSEQGRLYLQDVGDYDRQIGEINRNLAVLGKVEKYVVSKNSRDGLVPSTSGINDATLSQLLEKLYDSEIKYEKLRKTTAENNPILLSIANEINKIRPSILENIRSQKSNLSASLGNLSFNSDKSSAVLKTLPEKERQLLEISRRKLIKNDLFSFLQKKREETALAYAPKLGDGKVVDLAETSLGPVSPKPHISYIMAIALAFSLGIGYVIAKEMLGNTVLFRSEIEKYINMPIAVELPYVSTVSDKSSDTANNKNRKWTVIIEENLLNVFKKLRISSEHSNDMNLDLKQTNREAILIHHFRRLGATLGLYNRNFSKKKILVTSSIGGEGKSFVSTNLALSLAQAGKKVALLDMDFIKPFTSNYFNLSNSVGILDLLDSRVAFKDIVKSHPTNKNLSILPSGSNNKDYIGLLLNGELEILFENLYRDFDYVIIDSAPINLVAEVKLTAQFADKTLFVIRHDKTPRQILKHFEDTAIANAIKNVSIVFNGVKKRGLIGEDLGYGYGYMYRYDEAYTFDHE